MGCCVSDGWVNRVTQILLFYASHVDGMLGMCHHAQSFLLRWGLLNFFLPRLALNCIPSDLSLPNS
jgi:hypothetical protein